MKNKMLEIFNALLRGYVFKSYGRIPIKLDEKFKVYSEHEFVDEKIFLEDFIIDIDPWYLKRQVEEISEEDYRDLIENNGHVLTFDEEYTHKKTGNKYKVCSTPVINCTNEKDGQKMILYTRDGMIFVREEQEFKTKFEKI